MMERLTVQNKFGYDLKANLQVRGDCKTYAKAIDKLGEYEDLKEQGKLLELPCKVGDTLYRIVLGEIREYEVYAINIGIRSKGKSFVVLTRNHRGAFADFELIDFGKILFVTKEEAEAKMAEMEE